ncbi:MAG: hypothetical protein CMK09_05700 [Ponticaulis sp.]|nr:hypothetical protein [Ponticaulis sp.]|tara:strand:+ start:44362 stop:44787 length:426 start_codon:yes stop_codon:yes gene_type:complete
MRILFGIGGAAMMLQTPMAWGDATSWSCRNEHFEIACSEGHCEASESFTPMAINVSPTEFSLCAYTSCNVGPTTNFVTMGSFQVFMSDALKSTYPGYEDEPPGEAVVTIDTEDGVATIHWAGPFQTPAICEPVPVETDQTD